MYYKYILLIASIPQCCACTQLDGTDVSLFECIPARAPPRSLRNRIQMSWPNRSGTAPQQLESIVVRQPGVSQIRHPSNEEIRCRRQTLMKKDI
jgi:hypothetical protein